MRALIITALFDIKRDMSGDGRTLDDYLSWFGKTLQLNCDMMVFTESKFVDFVQESRKDSPNKTFLFVQKFEEIPFYPNNERMKDILNSDYFKARMKDLNRIECYLSEYNMIQYSKFGWLEIATQEHSDYDYYFWMDAGCSRFFGEFDLNKSWPNFDNIKTDKVTIQGNENFTRMFGSMVVDDYIWDNNSMLVGTLFGANAQNVERLHDDISQIFDYCVMSGCVNNEQFALAIGAKQNPDLFDIKVRLDGTHLPLFTLLGRNK